MHTASVLSPMPSLSTSNSPRQAATALTVTAVILVVTGRLLRPWTSLH